MLLKKYLLIIFLLVLYFTSNSQVWVKPGAVWHYDFSNISYGGFEKYCYVKDTIIENHNCQKITSEVYTFCQNQFHEIFLYSHNYYPSQFTYVSGDTVFYLNNGQFFVMYNFGANIGDSWIVSTVNPFSPMLNCDDTSRVLVLDTGKIKLNGVKYRFIKLQPTSNSAIGLVGTYVERFGNINTNLGAFQYLFPSHYQCDSNNAIVEWNITHFKCFEDSEFSLYNPSSQDCEYYLTYLGIQSSKDKKVECYPCPTKDKLNLNMPESVYEVIEIYNIQASMLRQIAVDKDLKNIDISDLNNGIYFLNFKSSKAGNTIVKVVKE